MKPSWLRFVSLLACPALLFTATTAPAKPSRVGGSVQLRYGFAPGQTNVYSLQIESQGESGKEIIGGTFVVSARPAGSNFIRLTLRGQLRNKPQPGVPFMGYRPGQPTLVNYTYGMPSLERELVIDDRGNVIRQAGDQALPIPLGQLATSLIQPLPAAVGAGWETEQEVFVLDEPMLQGPAPAYLATSGYGYGGYVPGMPGRSAQGVLAARQKTRFKVLETTPAKVVLHKSLALDTLFLTDAEPRVSANGEGEIEFDRTLGVPRRLELDCKMVAVTENVSRRSVMSLRWKLLEGEERDKALAPPAPVRPETKFTPEEVAKLQQQLSSEEPFARQNAARELGSGRLADPQPELLAKMATLVNDDDETVRRAALNVLASHGGKEEVPVLIKALTEPDSSTRTLAVKALGRLKDPRAIAPLVNLLATGQSDNNYGRMGRESAAAEALVRIGPAVEPAVLALLDEKNIETRIQACNILKQIGTKASLPLLQNVTPYPNKELSEAAAEACRAIQARQDK